MESSKCAGLEDICRLLERGEINAVEYYNFFNRRSVIHLSPKGKDGGYTSSPKKKTEPQTLPANMANKHQARDKKSEIQAPPSVDKLLTFGKDATKGELWGVGDNCGFRAFMTRAASTRHGNGFQRPRHSFCSRIKPSDIRYCSDKKREVLVNKILQEEKIKQIRRSLADYELFKGYQEGFNSSDERSIEEQIENVLPDIAQSSEFQDSISSAGSDSKSEVAAECHSDFNGQQRFGNSAPREQSDSTLSDSNGCLTTPYAIYVLKLSMIERDTESISRLLVKAESEVSLLHGRFETLESRLRESEMRLTGMCDAVHKLAGPSSPEEAGLAQKSDQPEDREKSDGFHRQHESETEAMCQKLGELVCEAVKQVKLYADQSEPAISKFLTVSKQMKGMTFELSEPFPVQLQRFLHYLQPSINCDAC